MANVSYATCEKCLKLNKISLEKTQTKSPACGACGAAIDFQHGIFNANTKQLQSLIQKSPVPIVVDFWAPWCGPCRAFAPAFERVANESGGQAVFVKVNTENDLFASSAFGVRGIPTIAYFNKGVEVDRLAGALPYDHFRRWVQQTAQSSTTQGANP